MKGTNYNLWVYNIAVLIAVLVGIFVGSDPMATTVLAVLGIFIGFRNITTKESEGFLVASVALVVASLAANGLSTIFFVGSYIGPILSNLTLVVAPAAIVVALKSLSASAK